ncbi:MAG: type 2 lanthipeptide synthetase LanM, partial [Cystobacter sp.]
AAQAHPDVLRPPVSPAEAVLAPWLAVAHARLAAMLSGGAVPVRDTARQDMVALLAQRLTGVCLRVLALEQRALEAASWLMGTAPRLDNSLASWWSRFEQYPALALLVTRTLLDWQRHLGELLTRLAFDRERLSGAFLGGRPLSALSGVEGDTGDMHDGGRSVAVLRFESGFRVVYKPKDLSITRATLELCVFLNEAGLPLPLHVRTVLVRGGYTWEEFVPAAPCQTEAEARRFFSRMGMLLRLFQLLEARDLFLDNLVAAGAHPVFIDLETMLQPRRQTTSSVTAPRAEELLGESVVHMGILALNALIAPGLPAEDFGAVTPPRPLMCPFPSAAAHRVLEGSTAPAREGYRVWFPPQVHSPHLGGKPVLAAEHLEELLAGYRGMQEVLCSVREELLTSEGPLKRLAGLRVRYIHRDTWDYMRLHHASLEPALLVHPARREAMLAAALDREADESRAVTQAELDALTRLDIPYFLCLTDGEAILGSDGQSLGEGFFAGTAFQRVEQRLHAVDTFPLPLHEDFIRSTLATGHHALPASHLESAEDNASGHVDWLSEATRLGEFLLDVAIQEEQGPVWLGLSLDPFHDVEQVEVLEPDLLSGSAGIACVLADLYKETGQERFRTAALGALHGTLEKIRRAPTELERGTLTARGTPFLEVGAFRGVGAWLYTLSRCARVLEEPSLARAARECAAALPIESLLTRSTADVGVGLAGLLLGLVACEAGPTARALVEAMERMGSSTPAVPPPFPEGARARRLLPSWGLGLEWCSARLGVMPRWLIHDAPESSSLADLLIQLDLIQASGNDVLRARVRDVLDAPVGRRSTAELLELLEVALVASKAFEDRSFLEHAQRLAGTLRARARSRKRWVPEGLAADRHQLSALWGLPAIAHGFLRLHAPGRVASLRLLEGVPRHTGEGD